MNTMVILLKRDHCWSPETWMMEHGGEQGVGGQIMIEGPSSWLSILRDDHILDEYEEDERAILSAMLVEPALFLVEWKGNDLIEALIQAVPPDCGAVVDNDHGLIVPLQKIYDLPLDNWIRARKLQPGRSGTGRARHPP